MEYSSKWPKLNLFQYKTSSTCSEFQTTFGRASRFVSGHGFSRAEKGRKTGALAPAGGPPTTAEPFMKHAVARRGPAHPSVRPGLKVETGRLAFRIVRNPYLP